MLLLVGLIPVGIIIVVLSAHDEPTEAQKSRPVKLYPTGGFAPLPRRWLPVPFRSTRWQIGTALVVYPMLGILTIAGIWFFRQLP